MKSIVVTYPYFQSLPKGIKVMLIASETFFFNDASGKVAPAMPGKAAPRPQIEAWQGGPIVPARRLSDVQTWWRN